MPESQTKVTSDHNEIRQWAQQRGGHPATVSRSGDNRGDDALLRFNFQGESEDLEPVSWAQFFETFDENNLVMLYQEETEQGDESRFFKFVSADTAKQAVE